MQPDAVARALHARDGSAAAFGIELVEAGHDGATVRMEVQPEMCNGFDIIHGGMTFVLADSAMAFASNSGNEMALATSAEIDWLAPVRPGQILVATAARRWSGGRSTVWDVEIRVDGDDDPVALFRGRTRRVTGKVIDD